jgi:UDP-glucose:(heptosyl)LPS alpha-1,3-glucosyltransferase
MKIALCHEAVLPSRGGCETYIANLARRLVLDGHQIHLYARQRDESALPSALHFHRVDLPPHPRFLRPWFFSAACRQLLARTRHDVSVGFDKVAGVDVLYPQAGVYAASVGFNLQKHGSPSVQRLLRVVKWFDPAHLSFLELERRGCMDPRTTVVAISDMVRRHLAEYYPTTVGRTRVLHIATPPDRLDESDRPRRRIEARRRWGLREGDVAALFAGMNYRLKGLVQLLQALPLVAGDEFRLLIAGKSETFPFERLAAELGVADRVRFLGFCSDMRDAYFAADLLVHPTFYDPCSNVVLEALACGLPVVTTRYNGAAELLRPTGEGHEARAEGYLVADPHDRTALAECLTRLLDPCRREQCAAAARRNAAEWTFERHYQRMLGILSDAAGRRRQAA